MPMAYYHGGPPGRQRGALLLPPNITGARTTADYGAGAVCRRDRVYVTTDINGALMFAAGQRRGVVYQVEPIGALEPDPDCTQAGLSFQCERARVLRIIKPGPAVLARAREVLLDA